MSDQTISKIPADSSVQKDFKASGAVCVNCQHHAYRQVPTVDHDGVNYSLHLCLDSPNKKRGTVDPVSGKDVYEYMDRRMGGPFPTMSPHAECRTVNKNNDCLLFVQKPTFKQRVRAAWTRTFG